MRITQYSPAGPRRAELSSYLEDMRRASSQTFADLAAATLRLGEPDLAVSSATLKRAASCHTVPQETTVIAFVRGCGGLELEVRDALALWRAARAEARGALSGLQAPSVRHIRTRPDLAAALTAAYERAGAPPLPVLQARAGTPQTPGAVLLPKTTAWRIVRRLAQPASWDQCEAFLRACGISPQRMEHWRQAWMRVIPADETTAPPVRATATGNPLRAESLSRIGSKLSLRARTLMLRMSAAELDAALTLGTAHLALEQGRLNGTVATVPDGAPSADLSADVTHPQLSPRETQIMRLLASGVPHRLVARQLCLTENTVRTYLHHIREKYRSVGRSVDNPVLLHYAAVRQGIVSVS